MTARRRFLDGPLYASCGRREHQLPRAATSTLRKGALRCDAKRASVFGLLEGVTACDCTCRVITNGARALH